MKKIFVFAFVMFAAIAFFGCTKTESVDRASLVARNWFVVDARFGTEKPAPGLFDNFALSLSADMSYVTTNPDAVPASPTRTTTNRGTWSLNSSGSTITFDAKSAQENRINIVNLSGNRMEVEWREEKPGKTATTYSLTLQAR